MADRSVVSGIMNLKYVEWEKRIKSKKLSLLSTTDHSVVLYEYYATKRFLGNRRLINNCYTIIGVWSFLSIKPHICTTRTDLTSFNKLSYSVVLSSIVSSRHSMYNVLLLYHNISTVALLSSPQAHIVFHTNRVDQLILHHNLFI